MDRRTLLGAGAGLLASLPGAAHAAFAQKPVARVILDNDYAGDPDGLFQLAHHLLCRSVTIPLIIGSHLPATFASGHDAADGTQRARDLLRVMGLADSHRPVTGSEAALASVRATRPGAAAQAIVREAMRSDTDVPLLYCAGAGLTDLALAWLAEPRIGKRLRLICIGGATHPGLGVPAVDPLPEFNFLIDPLAAQTIFNDSDIEIWQVPSDAYRKMLFGTGELEELGRTGPLGAYLKAAVDTVPEMLSKVTGAPTLPRTDAYVLGDSPLVTLSALVTPFSPDPASSRYVRMPTPRIDAQGAYVARADGRPMRVYTDVDADLTFRDMLARFRTLALAQAGPAGR